MPRNPKLNFPKKVLLLVANVVSWSNNLWKFIGGWTSCLFDALISLKVMPQPWVRINWRVRWRFFCSKALIGSSYNREKGEWLLGVLLLDQRNIPRYVFPLYPKEKLTFSMPLNSIWLFNLCSTRATVLQFMKRLQDLTGLVRTVLLSSAEAKGIILIVNSWKCLIMFFCGLYCLIICLSCLESSLFYSSCLSAWREIVVFRRPRTIKFLTAGGRGITPAAAAQGAVLGVEMHVWWCSILKHSKLLLFGLIVNFISEMRPALTSRAQRMKSSTWSTADMMYSSLQLCSWWKAWAALIIFEIKMKGLLKKFYHCIHKSRSWEERHSS